MRMSVADALKAGIITPSQAKAVRAKQPLAAAGKGRRATGARAGAVDPQRVLFDALVGVLGEGEVLYEVDGLVPGRKYRADIVIPRSRLVVEFDGFAFHRSKAAFQKDRDRQNAFLLAGWSTMRFVARQVFRDLDVVVAQIAAAARVGEQP